MADKIRCHIVEDLLPLYLEKQVQKETAEIIQKHLAECSRCRQICKDMASSVFAEIPLENDLPEKEYAEDKRYLLKVRRVLLILGVLIAAALIIFTALSYFLGKTRGEYSERFRLAEKHDLFYRIDQTQIFDGKKVTLDKILLDNSLTSVILKANFNLDYFDSIVLRDNLNNYYRRAFIPFEKFHQTDDIYILDFTPANPEASQLVLELTKFHGDNPETVTFVVNLGDKTNNHRLNEFSNLLNTDISGVNLNLYSLKQGLSHTSVEFTLDFAGTPYDGVAFGWYPKEGIKELDTLIIKDRNSDNPLKVLSVEDITVEKMLPVNDKTFPARQKDRTYKVITTPLPENCRELEMQIKNLYAFTYFDNQELLLDFSGANTLKLNREYTKGDIKIVLTEAVREKGLIRLYYEIKDQSGKILPDYLLDARIRKNKDSYEVPLQGKTLLLGSKTCLEFPAQNTSKYVLSLHKAGFELKSGVYLLVLQK